MADETAETSIRPGVERRLEFIEFRLYWEGGVNRADITGGFGVSQPQASNDLTQYQRRAPDNIRYDTSQKRYVPTPAFEPVFYRPNASQYLVELRSIADQVLSPADSWTGSLPEVGAMPVPGRRVRPEILRSLLGAVKDSNSIRVQYHSMTDVRPEPIWRWITPHALGFDGLRWHVRSYCHIDERFKDFVLSRFLEAGERGAPAVSPAADRDWNTFFEVVLKPNSRLGPQKMRTVELDYEMTDGRLRLSVRQALLYYLDKRLRLDIGEQLDKPHETPIIVANRADFESAIKNATGKVALTSMDSQ